MNQATGDLPRSVPLPARADRAADDALLPAIHQIEAAVDDPRVILPEPIFLLISRLVPLANVDLLIKDEQGRTLLTWRDDPYFGAGWHTPGSTIRYKERIEDRVRACARDEVGADVAFDPRPVSIQELIGPPERVTRGHCLALLYRCTLLSPPDPARSWRGGSPAPGQWAWHARSPADLLPAQRSYAPFLD